VLVANRRHFSSTSSISSIIQAIRHLSKMAQAQQKSALPVVLGAMTFGEEGKEQARVFDLESVRNIIDIFGSHGHREIDTARSVAGHCFVFTIHRIDPKIKPECTVEDRLNAISAR
jgi:hypothetical protein